MTDMVMTGRLQQVMAEEKACRVIMAIMISVLYRLVRMSFMPPEVGGYFTVKLKKPLGYGT